MSDSEMYANCIGNEMNMCFQNILIVTNTKSLFMAFNKLKGKKAVYGILASNLKYLWNESL